MKKSEHQKLLQRIQQTSKANTARAEALEENILPCTRSSASGSTRRSWRTEWRSRPRSRWCTKRSSSSATSRWRRSSSTRPRFTPANTRRWGVRWRTSTPRSGASTTCLSSQTSTTTSLCRTTCSSPPWWARARRCWSRPARTTASEKSNSTPTPMRILCFFMFLFM